MTKETITFVLACWGAVLSTVALLWNVRRDLTDRKNWGQTER